MGLENELVAIRMAPWDRLTEPCVLALGAFLFGYKMADASVCGVLNEAAQRFRSRSEADVSSKAYLAYPNTKDALEAVIDVLIDLNAGAHPVAAGPAANTHVVNLVREPIKAGRTGIVLLEPTVTWLANYSMGHSAGLRAVGSHIAEEQAESFACFEHRLQEEYGEPMAKWHAIVRIYEGADLHGLRRFLELWDEGR